MGGKYFEKFEWDVEIAALAAQRPQGRAQRKKDSVEQGLHR